MKGIPNHHIKPPKVCKVCGRQDSDQNTCMSCRVKKAKQKHDKKHIQN